MHSDKLLKSIDQTKLNIEEFITVFQNENDRISSFENWNSKDVVSHINTWVKYAGETIDSFKGGKPPEKISDANEYNLIKYQDAQTIDILTAKKQIIESLDFLKSISLKFNEEEMLSMTFPTGFLFELWKYILMDGFIHPNQHLMYHYLKKQKYNNFAKIVMNGKDNFLLFSDNDMNVFFLGRYFSDEKSRISSFSEMKKNNTESNDLLEKIISINITKDS